MILTNKTKRVICIANVHIAPGTVGTVPDSFTKNPVVKDYISKGLLACGDDVEPVKAASPAGLKEKALEDYTKAELISMAEEKGIDLSGATTKDQIIALIKGL